MVKTYLLNDTCYFNGHELRDKTTGEVTSLDPKIAQLLNYLIDNPDVIISRDQLLEQVWSNTVINENTINWSVSQLRKELGDDAKSPSFIKTVSKKGYIFCATVSQVDETRKQHSISGSSKITISRKILWLMLIGISLAVILFSYSKLNKNQFVELSDIIAITNLDGAEKSLLISKDKRKIYFLHKSVNERGSQIYYALINDKRVITETLPDGNTQLVESQRASELLQVLDDEYNYLDIVWGINQQSLFAARVRNDNTDSHCEIVQLELTESGTQISSINNLVDCKNSRKTKLGFLERKNTLYFNSRNGGNQYQLYSYDLGSERLNQVLMDNSDGIGYHFLALDLAQEKLLLLKDSQLRKTDFILFDLNTGSDELVLSFDDFYHSAYLSPDSQFIWHNWGNDLVVSYNLDTKTHAELLKTHVGWNYNLKPVDKNQVVFEVRDDNLNDLVKFVSGNFVEMAEQANEFLPALFEGGYAYVSTHSGLPQIWVKYQDKPAKQLSNLSDYNLFDELVASPTGRYIVGVTQQNLGLLDTTSQKYRSLTDKQYFPRNIRWSYDDILTFTEFRDETWNTYQVHWQNDDVTVEQLPINNAFITQSLPGGDYLYSSFEQDGLFRYVGSESKSVIIDADFPAKTYWRIQDNRVYYIDNKQANVLLRSDITNWQPEIITQLKPGVGGRFDVGLNGKTIIFERINRDQSNLMTAKVVAK